MMRQLRLKHAESMTVICSLLLTARPGAGRTVEEGGVGAALDNCSHSLQA
jgi:hypothetical protein